MTTDPTLLRPTPHHIVWTWQAPVTDWLGSDFRPFEDTAMPFLVIGEELDWPDDGLGMTARLTPLNLIHGLAMAGGEGPVPGDSSPREAQETAFSLLADGIGRSPQQALLDVASQLGDLMGDQVRIRVLRNAEGLGVEGSMVSCALAFALYRYRDHFPTAKQLPLAKEIIALFPKIVLDDLHPAAREHLLDITRLARELVRHEEGEQHGHAA